MTTKTLTLDPLYPDQSPAIGTALWVSVDRDVSITGAGRIAAKSAKTRYTVGRDGVFPTIDVVPNDDASLVPQSQGYALIIEAEATPSGGVTGGPWQVVVTSADPDAVNLSDLEQSVPSPVPAIQISASQVVAAVTDSADAKASAATAQAAATSSAQDAATSATAATNAANLVGAPAGTAIDAHLGGNSTNLAVYFNRVPGTGAYTPGDVLKFGAAAYNLRTDIGTGWVAGGAPNNYENVVGGNLANVNTGTSNLVGAAGMVNENGNWVFILGGYDNVVRGWATILAGYHCKVGNDANHITISGGSMHTVNDATIYGTIGGGTQNTLGGNNPTVAGGNANQAIANGATVAGGQTNTASGNIAAVGGGAANTASGSNATVGGGSTNTASNTSATVPGGQFNVASGVASVAAGRECVAYGDQSFATGKGAVATNVGERIHAGGNRFSYAGDAVTTTLTLSLGLSTAGPADMQTAGFVPPVIPELTTWMVTADVVARRNDATGEQAAWKVQFCVKRDMGNTTALVGTPSIVQVGANAGNTWALAANVYSVGNVRLVATGEAGKTTRWVARMEITQVQATPTAAWAASTAYNTGQRIVQGGGVLQVVNVSGTSGTVAPVTPAIGGVVTDGGVVWLRVS